MSGLPPSPSSPSSPLASDETSLAAVLADLLRRVEARATADGAAWLRSTADAMTSGSGGGMGDDLALAFPGVSRRVGRGGLGLDPHPDPRVTIGGRVHVVPLAAWRIDDAARAALLCAAAIRDPERVAAVARELYERGDPRERTAVLRALPLLAAVGRPEDAMPAVLDAIRTNQGEIFEAAICDNPYSAALLPEHEYRKAVLKAVFIGLPIQRIVLLDHRADAALAASLLDLVTEREAASRTVAPELWPVIARHPPPGLAAKLLGYLEHPSPEHRAEAATALGQLARAGDDRLPGFLHDRAGREPVAAVKDAIARAVA